HEWEHAKVGNGRARSVPLGESEGEVSQWERVRLVPDSCGSPTSRPVSAACVHARRNDVGCGGCTRPVFEYLCGAGATTRPKLRRPVPPGERTLRAPTKDGFPSS